MTTKRIVLADTDIIINLVKFKFFKTLEDLAKYYSWELYITYSIESECKDRFTVAYLKAMFISGDFKYFKGTSFQITKAIVELNKTMAPGAEIELYAIAKCENYNILSDDLENRKVFFKHNGSLFGKVWVYNLYHILYLAHKANLLTIVQIDGALNKSHKLKIRHLEYRILKNGFLWYCNEIQKNLDKHIDPVDSDKF